MWNGYANSPQWRIFGRSRTNQNRICGAKAGKASFSSTSRRRGHLPRPRRAAALGRQPVDLPETVAAPARVAGQADRRRVAAELLSWRSIRRFASGHGGCSSIFVKISEASQTVPHFSQRSAASCRPGHPHTQLAGRNLCPERRFVTKLPISALKRLSSDLNNL